MIKLANAEHLINAFEFAVSEMAFGGTIPLFSNDREEQRLITRERKRIKTNYTRTRNRLLKALTENEPVDGLCNPEPMSAEEEAFHRSKGTIV